MISGSSFVIESSKLTKYSNAAKLGGKKRSSRIFYSMRFVDNKAAERRQNNRIFITRALMPRG
jgi:hypothetical protein